MSTLRKLENCGNQRIFRKRISTRLFTLFKPNLQYFINCTTYQYYHYLNTSSHLPYPDYRTRSHPTVLTSGSSPVCTRVSPATTSSSSRNLACKDQTANSRNLAAKGERSENKDQTTLYLIVFELHALINASG